jgi:hypothetical protein
VRRNDVFKEFIEVFIIHSPEIPNT